MCGRLDCGTEMVQPSLLWVSQAVPPTCRSTRLPWLIESGNGGKWMVESRDAAKDQSQPIKSNGSREESLYRLPSMLRFSLAAAGSLARGACQSEARLRAALASHHRSKPDVGALRFATSQRCLGSMKPPIELLVPSWLQEVERVKSSKVRQSVIIKACKGARAIRVWFGTRPMGKSRPSTRCRTRMKPDQSTAIGNSSLTQILDYLASTSF